jgi:hypothetical protein
MKTMLFSKLRIATVLLVVGMLALGASTIPRWTAAAQSTSERMDHRQPKAKDAAVAQPDKKEITGLAREVVKMKIERLLNEKQEKSEAKTIIEDKETIAQVLAFFPETGTGKTPDRSIPRPKRGDGSSYFITLHRMKGDPDFILYIMVSPDRQMWGWSEGGPPCNDDWNLNRPKEVGKFLDDLLAEKRPEEKEKEEQKRQEGQADKPPVKPPHIVERTDMKGKSESHLPLAAGLSMEDAIVIGSKMFFAKMQNHPDIRLREVFDPRYLKKHGLTDRDIAFEVTAKWPWYQGIHSLHPADDNQTVLCILDTNEGKELFILRWVVYEGHVYISPEKAPDPTTGIFKPWILRTKVK